MAQWAPQCQDNSTQGGIMTMSERIEHEFNIKEITRIGMEADFLIEKNEVLLYCQSNYSEFGMAENNEKFKVKRVKAKAKIHIDYEEIQPGEQNTFVKPINKYEYLFNGQIKDLDKKNKLILFNIGFNVILRPSKEEILNLNIGNYIKIRGRVWLYDLEFTKGKKKVEEKRGKGGKL